LRHVGTLLSAEIYHSIIIFLCHRNIKLKVSKVFNNTEENVYILRNSEKSKQIKSLEQVDFIAESFNYNWLRDLTIHKFKLPVIRYFIIFLSNAIEI